MSFGTNDYPGYAGQTWDPYGYAARQCASFANWRCMHDLKTQAIKNPDGTNDGGAFATTLHKYYGVPMDGTPRVHDIVSFPAYSHTTGIYGHVAVVLAVNSNGTILVEDYNWAGTGQYSQHTITYAGCNFAHVQPPQEEDDDMNLVLIRNELDGGIHLVVGMTHTHMPGDGDTLANLTAAGVKQINFTDQDFKAVMANLDKATAGTGPGPDLTGDLAVNGTLHVT